MQWADEPNAGFSSASAEELIRPVVSGGEFGYERVNVDDQRTDPDSLLNWMGRAVGTRREHAVFGRGTVHFLKTDPDDVVSHRMEGEQDVIVAHNLSDEDRSVTLDVDVEDIVPIFGDGRSEVDSSDGIDIDLAGYGYVWIRVGGVQL